MALNDKKAGIIQPTRLETGPARELNKWKMVRRKSPPRTPYALGTWVRCSNCVSTGYLVSCRMTNYKQGCQGAGPQRATDLLVKLGDIVVELVRGLDNGGVLLDFLLGGHLGSKKGGFGQYSGRQGAQKSQIACQRLGTHYEHLIIGGEVFEVFVGGGRVVKKELRRAVTICPYSNSAPRLDYVMQRGTS